MMSWIRWSVELYRNAILLSKLGRTVIREKGHCDAIRIQIPLTYDQKKSIIVFLNRNEFWSCPGKGYFSDPPLSATNQSFHPRFLPLQLKRLWEQKWPRLQTIASSTGFSNRLMVSLVELNSEFFRITWSVVAFRVDKTHHVLWVIP